MADPNSGRNTSKHKDYCSKRRTYDSDNFEAKRTKKREKKHDVKKEERDEMSSDRKKTSKDYFKVEEELKHRLSQKYLDHHDHEKHKDRTLRNKVDKGHSPERILEKKERNKSHSPLQRDIDRSSEHLSKHHNSHHRHENKERHTVHSHRTHHKKDHLTSDNVRHQKHSGGSRNWDNQERNPDRNANEREDKDRYRDRRRTKTREWDRGKDGDTNTIEEFGNAENSTENTDKPEENKEEPNFALSGKLTEYTNTYNGVVIKYNEPLEARKPKTKWRLYPFKGDKSLPLLQLHRQSAFLLGRDRKIADIPIDHPSCSSQHAVLQFRLVEYERPDGAIGKKVKPYVIDLESTNGTFVNNNKIEARRYVEVMEQDVLKFGFSSREYVILHEKSKGEDGEEQDSHDEEQDDQEEEQDDEKSEKKEKKEIK